MNLLHLRALSKRYPGAGKDAVHGVDLDVADGEILGVVGASGSGKTTLLRLIAGLEMPTAGSLAIGGVAMAGPGTWVPPERRGIGFVFQEGALFPHMTIAENVGYGLRHVARRGRVAKVDEMLVLVKLPHKRTSYPHELSGGERQRIALARALAPGPQIILLDEPFSNLDPSLRTHLRNQLFDIIRRVHATALVVTHNVLDALVIADRLAIFRAGTLVQTGPSREVYHSPQDAYCARLFGPASLVPDAWSGHPAISGRTWLRPQDFLLHARAQPDALEVRIHGVQFLGHQLGLEVRPAGEDSSGEDPVLVYGPVDGALEVGATCWLTLEPTPG